MESIIAKGKLLKKVEIIVVDDGSKDKTLDLIIDFTSRYTCDKPVVVRGFQHILNSGKGAAVKYVFSIYSQ